MSNKDYIAFTIKKKRKKRHDYDATADYNKTIIKEPRKREKEGKKIKKTKLGESASDAPTAKSIARERRAEVRAYRMCTRCVR